MNAVVQRKTFAKHIVCVLLALVFGFFGLSLVFSNLGPGETGTIRIVTAVVFFLVAGAIVGLLDPTAWLLSGLAAWGAIFWGGFLTLSAVVRYGADSLNAQDPPFILLALATLVLPMVLSLVGGYIGNRLRQLKTSSFTRLP